MPEPRRPRVVAPPEAPRPPAPRALVDDPERLRQRMLLSIALGPPLARRRRPR